MDEHKLLFFSSSFWIFGALFTYLGGYRCGWGLSPKKWSNILLLIIWPYALLYAKERQGDNRSGED